MADRRIPYPLTLPSAFPYAAHDGSNPTTPDRPAAHPEHPQAVSVPVSRFRVRRFTGNRALSGSTFSPPKIVTKNLSDVPIPSIEVAVDDSLPTASCPPSAQSPAFLSPVVAQAADVPATPISQTVSFDGSSWKTARQRELGHGINNSNGSSNLILRPLSACSNFSNSSDDSDMSSFASSYGGTTCTSPERGPSVDPFTTPSKDDKYYRYKESLMAAARLPQIEALAPKAKTTWTQAMDDHLWTTYQLYLQDPTITPLKIVPGNAPPLGVCHRVARRARQTWREPKLRTTATAAARFSTPQPNEPQQQPEDRLDERHAFSDDDAALAANKQASAPAWPRGNATRRRLRELAKNRATIPTHYMRLIANRTPSPFTSSANRSPHSLHTARPEHRSSHRRTDSGSPNMGTRGVRIALATATSETMQPDGPLARWQRDTPDLTPPPPVADAHAPHAFNEPATTAHAPSSSMPSSISTSSAQPVSVRQPNDDLLMLDAPPDAPPRLGSPFVPNRNHTWAAPGRRSRIRPSLATAGLRRDAPSSPDSTVRLSRVQELLRPATSTGPCSLRSPIQFTSTFPYNRSLGSKRRAEHSLEDIASPRHNSHRRPALNDVFGPSLPEPAVPHNHHNDDDDTAAPPVENRRVRLRGFSLNDAIMQNQHDRQAQHQPTFSGLPELVDDPFVDRGRKTLPGVSLAMDAPRQLGSPFQLSSQSTRPSRFRVRHFPHKSLDSYPTGLFGSIGERLGDQ